MTFTTENGFDPFTSQLIERTARNLARTLPGESADYAQELRMHVVVNRGRYQPERGRWTTFVKKVIENQAISLWRSNRVTPNSPQPTSLHQLAPDGEAELLDLVSRRDLPAQKQCAIKSDEELINLQQDVEALMGQLSPSDRTICVELARYTVSEAARRLKLPRSTLSDRIAKIRRRFEDAGMRKYL